MNTQSIIDRLAFQTQALQEGFDILSKVKTLEELAKQYCHILRGSLLTVDINLFFQPDQHADWQALYLSSPDNCQFFENLPRTKSISITYPEAKNDKIKIILPLISGGYFGLIMGSKLDKSDFNDFDRISLQIFLQLLDSAYQSFINRKKEKELVFSLNQRVVQLNSLIDTGIEISKLTQNSSLRHMALERVVALTNASRGMLRITHKNKVVDKIFFPAKFSYRNFEQNGGFIETNFYFQDQLYVFKLFGKESRQGTIPFDPTDQLLLDAFSRQLNVALENNYLHEEALEKQRIDNDIKVAATIQQKILPATLPEINGYQVHGINIPTRFVGGDYYDCLALPDGRFALIIADVAGKGVPAALLVSSLNASLSAYLEHHIELADLAQRLNKVIYSASTDDKYITFYIGIFDPKNGQLESLNAGHNPIYHLKKDRTIVELAQGGIPFGMLGLDFPYTSERIIIEAGESLLLYTDGVTEAMNEKEEQYDDIMPLKNFLQQNHHKDAVQFVNNLIADIDKFTGNTPQSDDITALYLKRIA